MKIRELAVQNVLEAEYRAQGWGVKREVETGVGYIDILIWKPKKGGGIEKCLIEVKERGGLKSAIGQVQMYSRYEPSDRLAIIYFSYDGKDKPIDDTYYSVKSYGERGKEGQVIEIESINRILDISKVYAEQERLNRIKGKKGKDTCQTEMMGLTNLEHLICLEETLFETSTGSLEELHGSKSDEIMW
jgi:hypothetical protein